MQKGKDMKMQDKEFDELFRSKLDDLEIEPTTITWKGINEELNTRQQKKVFIPLLSIAASIIILLAAGLLFNPRKKQSVNHLVAVRIEKTEPKTLIVVPDRSVIPHPAVKSPAQLGSSLAANQVPGLNRTKQSVAPLNPFPETPVVKDNIGPEPIRDQPESAINTSKPIETIPNMVKANATELTTEPELNTTSGLKTKPITVIQEVKAEPAFASVKKHRIRSLGDLVNVVIAKVDKRKDKIIEFSSTDDDETSITGLNLGIIRIKKQVEK